MRPPWLESAKAAERGVYDHYRASNRFQEKVINEFIKDALFLEISGICSGTLSVRLTFMHRQRNV